MQPTLAITVPAPGMIYVNGRFLGEAAREIPLLAPVSPFGAVYIEYRPLEPGWLPLARRIVLSSGAPLLDSLSEDVFAVRWPGSITEIELSPLRHCPDTQETFSLDGMPCKILRGTESRIAIGGLSCRIPSDASAPSLRRLDGCTVLTGAAGTGRYMLTLSDDLSRQTGFLQADRLELDADGTILATTSSGDFAGHGTLERWQAEPSGLRLVSSEPVWTDGEPHIPGSPEEAALAAVQAALLGQFDEAESHLSPALRVRHPLDGIGEAGSLCVPMKYGRPGGRSCVGLLRVDGGSCATVIPIYCQGEKQGGRWLLTELAPDA